MNIHRMSNKYILPTKYSSNILVISNLLDTYDSIDYKKCKGKTDLQVPLKQ